MDNLTDRCEWLGQELSLVPLYKPRKKAKAVNIIASNYLIKMQRAFKYTNYPDTIKPFQLEKWCQINGKVLWFMEKDNLYCSYGGYSGILDYNYIPKYFQINNPYIPCNKKFEIGVDAVVMRNDHYEVGLTPLLSKYCYLIEETELSLYVALVQSRNLSILTATGDKDKLALENYLKSLEAGDLGAVTTKNILKEISVQPYGNASASLTPLIETNQYLKASLNNELGLDSNYNMKREALSMTESQMNSDALRPFIDDMFECRLEAIDEVNRMFGTNIKVERDSSWETNHLMEEISIEQAESSCEESETIKENGDDSNEND